MTTGIRDIRDTYLEAAEQAVELLASAEVAKAWENESVLRRCRSAGRPDIWRGASSRSSGFSTGG
ncbi:hypothetical protein ACF06N_21725 [Streptomyces albidoflavus]